MLRGSHPRPGKRCDMLLTSEDHTEIACAWMRVLHFFEERTGERGWVLRARDAFDSCVSRAVSQSRTRRRGWPERAIAALQDALRECPPHADFPHQIITDCIARLQSLGDAAPIRLDPHPSRATTRWTSVVVEGAPSPHEPQRVMVLLRHALRERHDADRKVALIYRWAAICAISELRRPGRGEYWHAVRYVASAIHWRRHAIYPRPIEPKRDDESYYASLVRQDRERRAYASAMASVSRHWMPDFLQLEAGPS